MPHFNAPSSQKRCTKNEDREWVLLVLEGLASLSQRSSLWTLTCQLLTEPEMLRGPGHTLTLSLELGGSPQHSHLPQRSRVALLSRIFKMKVHLYRVLQLRTKCFLS